MNILFVLFACSESEKSTEMVDEPICLDIKEMSCFDELILDLALHSDKISEGEVENVQEEDDFITYVDASAGGYMEAANNPWVYIKFTPTGAQKVSLDDEIALESMEWDLSLKRYILRLNGGSSGPSCIGAATLLDSTYDEVDIIPEGIVFREDDFYTSDCTLINDSSGLPNSPQVALGSWWTYPGCVATSMYPHLIQLADGAIIKLVVEAYYGSGQDICNATGNMGTDSAQITLRWSYL